MRIIESSMNLNIGSWLSLIGTKLCELIPREVIHLIVILYISVSHIGLKPPWWQEQGFFFLNFFFFPECEIFWGMWNLVPWLGFEPMPLALGAQSLSHWATKEVLRRVAFLLTIVFSATHTESRTWKNVVIKYISALSVCLPAELHRAQMLEFCEY